ncbi:MAG: hypothetical protein AVDCRST_MAG49-3010, partial [uncultured Thermomicrobiales bacterium]
VACLPLGRSSPRGRRPRARRAARVLRPGVRRPALVRRLRAPPARPGAGHRRRPRRGLGGPRV